MTLLLILEVVLGMLFRVMGLVGLQSMHTWPGDILAFLVVGAFWGIGAKYTDHQKRRPDAIPEDFALLRSNKIAKWGRIFRSGAAVIGVYNFAHISGQVTHPMAALILVFFAIVHIHWCVRAKKIVSYGGGEFLYECIVLTDPKQNKDVEEESVLSER